MYCMHCGHKNEEDAKFCDNCGKPLNPEQQTVQSNFQQNVNSPLNVENNSGRGKMTMLPPQLYGWNWGAFFLNWIWGIGNNTFIALLCLLPFINIVMIFVLDAKGNEWAWQNKRWQNIEHFKRVQRLWAIWGFILFALGIIFSILIVVAAIAASGEYNY